jgi:hypothetical protein
MSRDSRIQVTIAPKKETMPSMTMATASAAAPKRKAAPVPREHGAWFMLGHCLLIGALVGGSFTLPVLLIIVASVLSFMAMQGLKQLARAFRNRQHGVAVRLPKASAGFLAGAVAAGAAAVFGWNLYALLIWGIVSFVITAVYAWVLFRRKERSVLGEWLGITGLTLSAGAVWTAGTGRWGTEALILWALALLYFGGTVPYVKFRVKQMKKETHRLGSRMVQSRNATLYCLVALGLVALAALLDFIPFLAAVPFVLSLAKVLWTAVRGKGPQKIAHVGYGEAVFSTVFAIFTIVAFWPGN